MKNKNPVITETLRILVGMTVCLGLMLLVYWAIGRFSIPVLIGGIVGTVMAVGNFFFMGVGLSNLADDATESKIRLRTQSGFLIRTLVILALLVLAIKFCNCDALATLLPLLFVRPVLMLEQLILKSKLKSRRDDHES